MDLSKNKGIKDYTVLLTVIKQQVKRSQLKAVISANSQMLYILVYRKQYINNATGTGMGNKGDRPISKRFEKRISRAKRFFQQKI